MLRQRTLSAPVHAVGIGVHSAEKVQMTLRPADANTGIRFRRTGRTGRTERTGGSIPAGVAALATNVCDTTLSTSISNNGVQVATIEHLMSALWGLGIDHVCVELNAGEVPIMDGSAAPFIYLMQSVGVRELPAAKRFIRIKREISVSEGDATVSLKPHNGFKADYTFVADHPVYNRHPKHVDINFSRTSYVREVSRARSFGLLRELEQAHAINRCLGSSLDNAVGIDDFRILNLEGLRYEDEFVKHKMLDAIGDLYLLGVPVLGAFSGHMSGHALNTKLAQAVLHYRDAWDLVIADDVPTAADARELQPVVV
ncbi:MAG: UDP-3-O-acyl-N-acetylglucosamine deacetylase [Gammaproteobacteria bacterium]|nr:UDP-3-O-acyl-N-acetylglucosamine deacetylase [Gammaproteobacteria bacterium]